MPTRRSSVIALSGAILALGTLLAAPRAGAIPAFARKYQLSCSTCHAPFPRLKPFGEEFAARGFRMEDPSKEPTRATYDVGDPLLKLARDLPLGIRLEGHVAWKDGATAESDAEWPWVFKVLSGGQLTNDISYYFYFIGEKGEVNGLEDAYLQFNSVGGLPVDVVFGQFQVSDPLFKRELRLLRTDYDVFKTHVGAAHVDLTYDRGLVALWHAPFETEVVFELVNGNGIGQADDFGSFDSDNFKNVALRVSRELGPVRLGAFGYSGRERGAEGRVNRTTWWGPDLVVDLSDRAQLNVEYLERRDDDPFFTGAGGPKWKTRGGFAELHVFPEGPDGLWVLTALYNKVDSDDPGARSESGALAVNRLLGRNVRLLVEVARDFENDSSRFSLGLVTAF